MAARRVDPPNTPPARLPAPQATAAVSRARPNATPAGNVANALARPPARKPGGDERSATREAKRASGDKRASHEPQPAGAPAARVVRPVKRVGSGGAQSRDPSASTTLSKLLFEFTAPAGGLPRSAEIVAILSGLLAVLPTLPHDLRTLAESALRQEFARQSALLTRSHQSLVR